MLFRSLLDELNGMKFVRIIQDFPDGYTLNIPSIGEAETADFQENQAVKYNAMATGNFQFSFNQYKYSANAISEKFKRDRIKAAVQATRSVILWANRIRAQ